MTSFVADVLATAGKLEKLNLHKNITEVQKEITKLEYEVKDFMDENYIEFSVKMTRDAHLVKKTEQLLEEINVLQNRINNQMKVELSGSTKELKTLSQTLKESNISLKLSHHLISLHECIKSIKETQEKKQFVKTAKTLQQMHSLLDDSHSLLHNLEIYTAMKNEYCNLSRSYSVGVSKLLQDRICWSTNQETDKTVNLVTIKSDDIQELMQGLHIIENLENNLQAISTKLMDYIIDPIIHDRCSVYVVKEKTFTVEILEKKDTPCYKSVLHNVKMLFMFLHNHLNLKIVDNDSFLSRMRPHLLDRLSHTLTTDCISHIVPTSNADLKNFKPIVNTINEFQNYLVEIEFLTKDQLFLSEYTNNIDKLFINRICRDLLVKARNIVKKDLYDSVQYEPQGPFTFSDKLPAIDYEIAPGKKLSDVSFQMPKCQISKSAQEILELAKTTLDEACNSSDVCAVKLFYTCRDAFELYAVLLPQHHRTFLETIPYQVALCHNNYMYLAHHLLTLAHDYIYKFPENLQKLTLTFVDQVFLYRNIGSEIILDHMKYQRNIIFGIIKDSGFSGLGLTPELHPSTERALRQCLRQLEILKSVWFEVLPNNLYCVALGCITNSMIDDLTMKVISVEDIPANVATKLVTLFNMMVTQTPQIFPEPNKIQQYVRKWGRFLELITILGASLKEIEVRWMNGKGPLAKEFTIAQIKQLIRALFQNTERRSNLLASIK